MFNNKIYSNHSDKIRRLGSNNGFTIIELLVVLAITAIIAGAAIPIYGNLQASSQLDENTTQIIQTIRTAQANSVGRVNGVRHGVKLNTVSFVLYQGDSYATRNTNYDRVTDLDSVLSLNSSLTNNEINFSLGLGEPDGTGIITLTHEVDGTNQITINEFGIVDKN